MTVGTAGTVRRHATRRSWYLRLAATLRRVLRNRIALVGLVIVAIQVGAASLAPFVLIHPPDAIDYRAMLQEPSAAHLLGTDDLGRDILSRLIYGARLSLAVSTMAVALAVLLGLPLGLVSGYLGGWIDELLMRLLDSVMALPPLVLALTIAAVLGPGLFNAMIAIAIVSVPTFTRLVRGQVLSLKHNDYITAAHSVGVPAWRIVFQHILPNALNPVIVQATLGIGFAIITESSLSFIGLGAQPPTSTWGSMVQVGFQYLELAPWYVLAPASMMFLAVLGFNMLGDGLRDALDPRLRER
jgi:ABC-type dipeptide/oligopeptide/nickel transport system permease subunit